MGLNRLIVNLRATVLGHSSHEPTMVTSNAQDGAGRSLDDPERVRAKAAERLADRSTPDDDEISLLLVSFFNHRLHDLPDGYADRKREPGCLLNFVDLRMCAQSHAFLKLAFTFK